MRLRRSAWLKMIAHVHTDAASSPIITALTTMSADMNRVSGDIRSGVAAVVMNFLLISMARNASTHARGLAARPAIGREKSGGNPRLGECFSPAHDPLMNERRGGADGVDMADDDEIVAEPRRAEVADRDVGDGIDPLAGIERGALVDPDGAQHVRPSALHILQIIGVIDDSGGVGVLEIDAQRKAVLSADEAAAIGCVEGRCPIATALTSRVRGANPADETTLDSDVTLKLHVT